MRWIIAVGLAAGLVGAAGARAQDAGLPPREAAVAGPQIAQPPLAVPPPGRPHAPPPIHNGKPSTSGAKSPGLAEGVGGTVGGVLASAAGSAAGGPLGGAAAGFVGQKLGAGVVGFFKHFFRIERAMARAPEAKGAAVDASAVAAERAQDDPPPPGASDAPSAAGDRHRPS